MMTYGENIRQRGKGFMSYKPEKDKSQNCIICSTLFISIFSFLFITLFFTVVPDFFFDSESESAVAEIHGFFYFLTGVATFLLVYVAYKQVGPINKTAKAEFLLRIDERWNSKEITRTRKKLWTKYRKGRQKYREQRQQKKKKSDPQYKKSDKEEKDRKAKEKKVAIEAVGLHIISVHEDDTQIDLLFEYLNFMELLGTINYIREEGLIDEDFVDNLFGGKLRTYVEFYELYFVEEFGCKSDKKAPNEKCEECEKTFLKGDYCEKKEHPQALKLLHFFRAQENSVK